MPISRTQKESVVESYQEGLVLSPNAFLLNFSGVSVPEVTDLRHRIRDLGCSCEVVKNRLALRAIQGTALEGLAEHFEGPTAVAFGGEDPVALAKVLTDFAKEVPAIEFKAGLVDGQTVAGEEVKAIAGLPSREDLITKLLYLLQSPVSRLVRGLGAIPQQFVSVLEQVRQQKDS